MWPSTQAGWWRYQSASSCVRGLCGCASGCTACVRWWSFCGVALSEFPHPSSNDAALERCRAHQLAHDLQRLSNVDCSVAVSTCPPYHTTADPSLAGHFTASTASSALNVLVTSVLLSAGPLLKTNLLSLGALLVFFFSSGGVSTITGGASSDIAMVHTT